MLRIDVVILPHKQILFILLLLAIVLFTRDYKIAIVFFSCKLRKHAFGAKQDYPDCQIFGETFGTDHHDELLKLGINPYVKGSEEIQQISFIIYCAPPSRGPDCPGDVRSGQ